MDKKKIGISLVAIVFFNIALYFILPNAFSFRFFYSNIDFLHKTKTDHPKTLALLLAGFPNADGTQPGKVMDLKKNKRFWSILIKSDHLKDDSIMAVEYRVDFNGQAGQWIIKWAGVRHKCRRSYYKGWTTSPCP